MSKFVFALTFFFISFFGYSNNTVPAFKKILIIYEDYFSSEPTLLQTRLLSTNKFNTVDLFQTSSGTPTLSFLNTYDAVFLWTNYTMINSFALGNILAEYVNEGHGVVTAVASLVQPWGLDPTSNFFTSQYILSTNSTVDYPTNLHMVKTMFNHPILQGVNAFSQDPIIYLNTVLTHPSSLVIANWDNSSNTPMIIVDDNIGLNHAKRVDLNFFPVYFEQCNTSSISDAILVVANSLLYVSNGLTPTFTNPGPVTICEKGSYFLDPSTTTGTWLSSDPSVATVDAKGYVTGLIPGTTTISLENSGGTVSASITVGSSSELSITDPLAQASYKINNNPQGPIGGTINYVGYNGFNYSSQTRPINSGFYKASMQSGNEAGCPYQFYIYRCSTCGTVPSYGTRPEGTFIGDTIQANGTGQLVFNSSNGLVGPFTIVYQLIGGETKTVTNVSSGQAFNLVTTTITTSYKLISVTDETTKSSTDFANVIGTISVVPPPTATLTGGSQSICPGATADLNVAITGTGAVTVTLNDGTVVTFPSGTISGTISVTPASATTYTISSVVDITGSGTSTGSSTVNFYAPASITVQPVSPITIIEGSTATLSVTATGEPTLNYQWYKDGNAISGANSYSYTTTNTTSAAGTYYVIVSTTCNVVSSTTSTVSVTDTYTIGQAALGGTIAYILQYGDPGYDANVQHGLVATVADISTSATWGCSSIFISGADGTAIGTGNQNTIDIKNGCATAGIAARLCGDLTEGGYSDWYLPSKDELNKLYLNKTAIGGFADNDYWSSTEYAEYTAWSLNFFVGYQNANDKNGTGYVRAIRAF